MKTPNLGWFYYRDLYNAQRKETIEIDRQKKEYMFSFDYLKYANTKEGEEHKKSILKENTVVLKERSQEFFNKKLKEYKSDEFFTCETATNSFELTTTYPGLLCGVGYNHGISSEADFKVGFYFDHTTGLPVIPGSSVKGVLRSAFPCYIRKDEEKLSKEEKEDFEKRYDFFRWIIAEVNRKTEANISFFSNREIDTLEAFIFEGQNEKGEQISYYRRDRFFDAYPQSSLEKDGYFLKNDYITPHINREKPEMSPFTNPNPIQFMKVLPKVKFRFQFQLIEGGGLDEKQKELLFKEILCFSGIGAKTNVGYGQFEEGFEEIVSSVPKPVVKTHKTEPAPYNGKISSGEKMEAIVVDSTKKLVKVFVKEYEIIVPMSGFCPKNESVVQVKINLVNNKRVILQVGFLREL